MSCSLIIKQNFDQFTSAEKKIANYILSNSTKLYKLSAAELAALTGTSAASVVRFAKKVGFAGFQELKIELAKEDANKENEIQSLEYIDTHDSVKDIIRKIGDKNIQTIEETLKLQDELQVQHAIDSILKGKNIYLFGIGVSALVAMDFQYKLVRINKSCTMHLDSHLQLASAVHISKEDIAIAISYSGSTKEVYTAFSTAKKNGAKCISITKYGNNPISNIADIHLFVPSIEKDLRVGAISSRIAQLTLVDILFIGVAKQNFDSVESHLKVTKEMVKDFKL